MHPVKLFRNTERTVNVKYSDGFVEKYIVAYNGVVNVAKEERGSASFPDSRQCLWSIQAYVERQIYSVNRQGQRAVLNRLIGGLRLLLRIKAAISKYLNSDLRTAMMQTTDLKAMSIMQNKPYSKSSNQLLLKTLRL